ncbi:MAG: hypothetical protein AB1700_20920 [Bacillota bacterium]
MQGCICGGLSGVQFCLPGAAYRTHAIRRRFLHPELCERVMVINHGKLIFDDAEGRRKAEPGNGAWQIISVDYVSQTVDVAFDRSQSPAPVVLWAMQVLGDIKDVSLTEAGIEETVKWLLAH